MDKIRLLKGAAPFFYPGNEIGCLTLHGITGTPFEVRWLGQHLSQQGYTVYGPRLAGHATTPDDLAQTTWREWYACALSGYEILRAQCDKVFVIGLSMGGALTLLLSSWEDVDGLVTLSAPYEINDPRKPILPLVSRFIKTLDKGYEVEELNRFDRQVRSEQQKRGEELTGHPSYTRWVLPGVVQLFRMMEVMRTNIGQISASSLHVHAKQDKVVPFENLQKIYDTISSTDKEMLVLENGGHCVAEDVDHEIVFEAVSRFVAAHAAR